MNMPWSGFAVWTVDILSGLSVGLGVWVLVHAVVARKGPSRVLSQRSWTPSTTDGAAVLLRRLDRPARVVLPLVSRTMSKKRRASLARRLRYAGLKHSVEPEFFEALRLIGAIGLGAVGLLLEIALAMRDGGSAGEVARGLIRAFSIGALLGWVYPIVWLRKSVATRNVQIRKVLPFYLDLITLCVEAGLGLRMALERAVRKGPRGLFNVELQRVLRDVRAGRSLADSFRDLAERVDVSGVEHFVMAVVRAERMGLSLGPILRMQADQQRSERFLRAERLALEAPVKMLLPLVLFVFPCTFIVIFFPLAMRFLGAVS